MSSRANKEDKKKRLGSRRFKVLQNETCEAEENGSSSAQCHIPEEITETSNILSNPDKSQNETQHQPLSERSEKRRKLGSSRINKERQHLKDPETESYNKPKEEFEEMTIDKDLEPTHMSCAMQFENQEELSRGEEQDVSATHDSSLYSVAMPDYSSNYSSEIENATYPEDVLKLICPKSKNLQANENECKVVSDLGKSGETMLEETCKSDTLQSEEVEENTHNDFSDITSLGLRSYPSIDQQLNDQSNLKEMPKEEHFKVRSGATKENTGQDEETDMLPQEGNLQSPFLMSDSHVESFIEFSVKAETTDRPTQAEKPPIEEVICDSFPASLASQLPETPASAAEQTDSGITPIGKRRKLGSSRITKERPHVKESVVESYHKAEDEAAESIQTTVETRLEGVVTSDTHQNEECSSQVKEATHLLSISELSSSSPEVSQQLISAPGFGEMLDEFPSVSPVSENGNNVREHTEQAILQASSFVSEPHVSSEIVDSSITPEVSTEISCCGEQLGHKCGVEEAIAASEKELCEKNEHFNFTHTVEITDVCSGIPANQAESKDTQQPELQLNHSATKWEVSNPDKKHNKSSKENNSGALDQISKDAYDTKKPHMGGTEKRNPGLSQVYEIECHVEDDMNLKAEQTSHQQTKGYFSEGEESKPSSQNLESEIHSTQTQGNVMSTDEPSTDFSHTGHDVIMSVTEADVEGFIYTSENVLQENDEGEEGKSLEASLEGRHISDSLQSKGDVIRVEGTDESATNKLGSLGEHREADCSTEQLILSSKEEALSSNKEPSQVQPSEDGINILNGHDIKQIQMQGVSQTDSPSQSVAHDAKENPASFSVNPRSQVEFKDTSDAEEMWKDTELVEAAVDEKDNADNLCNKEAGVANPRDDAANKGHEDAAEQAHKQELCHDYTPEKVIRDTADSPEFTPVNPADQDTRQSATSLTNTDDSDNKPTSENNMTALNQTNQDHHISAAAASPRTSGAERVESNRSECQAESDIKPSAEQTGPSENEGPLSQADESKSSLDPQTQDTAVSIKEHNSTDLNAVGGRRKLGASRKNKGRRRGEETAAESHHRPTEVRNSLHDDSSEPTKTPSAVETGIQDLSAGTVLEVRDPQTEDDAHTGTSDLTNICLHSSVTVDPQVKDPSCSLITETPSMMMNHNEEHSCVFSMTDTENTERDRDTDLLRQWGFLQANGLLSNTHSKSEPDTEPSVTPEKSTKESSPGMHVEQATLSSSQEEVSTNEEQNEHFTLSEVTVQREPAENAAEKVHEEEPETTEMQPVNPVDNSVNKSKSSVQSLQAEVHAPLDSQTWQRSQNAREETHAGPKPADHRRKLGSSRRNKGRQHELDSETFHKPKDYVENTSGDEACEATKVSLTAETTRQEDLKRLTDRGVKPTDIPEEDASLSPTVAADQAPVTPGVTPRSDEYDTLKSGEEEVKHRKETEDVALLTSGNLTAVDGCKIHQDVQEETHSDSSELLEDKSKQRKRKMGSSRRNLGSHHLHQKQQVGDERTETGGDFVDELSENVSGTKGLQSDREHQDSDSEQKKATEKVEHSHISESQFKPLAEENPASLSRAEEAELQVSADDLDAKPSTSPKQGVMAESSYGGRRRKLGSHRKSHGNPHYGDPTATEGTITDDTQERGINTTSEHRNEPSVPDKIVEVDESDKILSSNIGSLKAGAPLKPGSDKGQVTPGAEIRRNLLLAGDATGADAASRSYNVLMVGDTSVGKTSFMKRAQSGKFSLDSPSSIGLDSCMWTVVVDGKPVVLHLWDTAGQERFHSITRQIFHKAQAFLLMYDITSSKSFSAVSYWVSCIQEGAAEDVSILLVGNKSDCTQRWVQIQDGENLAKESDFQFMECSAATGDNVIECLETMARTLSEKADIRQEAMALKQEPPQKKRSGCC